MVTGYMDARHHVRTCNTTARTRQKKTECHERIEEHLHPGLFRGSLTQLLAPDSLLDSSVK
jgi:hypothetical protein